ncbi:MAG TPA: hypothetical protein VMG10_16705 [Gemmataceae bacterium]|nr:hypothetical protein [Gemmataceae bacterium]
MNRFTAFFLILLRLAIGWHFFAEGYHKLDGYWRGATETALGKSKPFSSAGYFREGTGPLAQYIRQQIGDPDQEALALLEPNKTELPNAPPHKRTPSLLHQEWSDYITRFEDYYNLDDDQKKKAEEALTKAEDDVVGWLTRTAADEKNLKAKTQEGRLPMPARLAQLKQKLEELSEPKHSHLVSIGADAESERLHNIKGEVVRLRTSLLNELDEYTQELKKKLEKIPSDEQTKAAQSKGKAPQPEQPPNPKQHWIDLATMYGLAILGACLILGLFSRTACLLSASFLLMTYLCMPPFPWLPSAPNNEGYYLFVNKNVIEMLALLALMTTRSGYWFGVDAIIHWMLFGRRRPAPPPQSAQ